MAIADIFKKWKAEKQTEPQDTEAAQPTVIVPVGEPVMSPAPNPDTPGINILNTPSFKIPEPLFPEPGKPKKTYQLTFRDAGTGRSLTDTFAEDTELHKILDRMEEAQILSIPRGHICMTGVDSLNRQGAFWPIVSWIKGVYSGMTVDVDFEQTRQPRLHTSGAIRNLRKEYPLAFFRKENGACVERIDFVCYGYERPDDITFRLLKEEHLREKPGRDYKILYWPTCTETNDWGYNVEAPQYVCEFDPQPGRVFILEDYEAPPPRCMYGCPAADLPRQMDALQNRCVDIIDYE